jgi:AcrR family transcriptional regulator
MSEPRPQRWKRRKAARPQEILEAALGVFAQKGFARTRMEDIAQEAGVTKGTIYLYFENKEAVFKSLVGETIGSTLAQVIAQVERFEGSSGDLLRMALTAIGRFVLTSDRVVLPKIIIAEAGNFPDMVRFYRTEIIDKGLGVLTRVIERGMARGEFRAAPPEHVARLCIAPLLLGAFWRTTFAQFDTEPYDYEGLIATHIDILLRGLAPEERTSP